MHIHTVLYQINVCVWRARKINENKMHLKGCSLLMAVNKHAIQMHEKYLIWQKKKIRSYSRCRSGTSIWDYVQVKMDVVKDWMISVLPARESSLKFILSSLSVH